MYTDDTNLATDTEAENTTKENFQSTHQDFIPLMRTEENSQEDEKLRVILRVKSQRRKMLNMKILKGFVQSQNMRSLSGIFQKFG